MSVTSARYGNNMRGHCSWQASFSCVLRKSNPLRILPVHGMAEFNIQNAFDLALQHHQAGRLAEAERLYRQILTEQPDDLDAMHLLGVIAYQTGRNDIAVDLIREAIALDPEFAEAYYNLGNALAGKGSLVEAIAAYRQAVALDPNLANAHLSLGVALRSHGQLDEAIAVFQQVIALNPQSPEVYNTLARTLKQKGELDGAITAYRQAITLRPEFAEAHSNLGNALQEKGELDDAIAAYRLAISLRPDLPETHSNLGSALKEKGDLNGAIAAYRKAIALRPNFSEAHSNLGIVLRYNGQLDEAIASYRQAIALRPNFAEVHNNLGIALHDKGELDEAIAAYHRAIALKPNFPEAHSNLGNSLRDRSELTEAVAAYRQAIALRPDFSEAHSNLVYALYLDTRCTQAELLAEHRFWAKLHADPFKSLIRPHENDRGPNRRLRIGYVSPDFHSHPVGRFILPLLAAHDHKQFEIYCYASVLYPDSVTARIQRQADVWRDIGALSDEEAAKLISEDRIDILIDLSLHTAKNRMLLFARKPAPIQATYLAYPGTSGMEMIDYRITDPHLDPPGSSDNRYTEQSIRLDETYWCYEAVLESPEVNPLPAAAKGFVTFACLNNFSKNSAAAIQTWCRILTAVPNSRLLLYAAVGSHRDAVRQKLSDAGIDPNRLSFAGRIPFSQYMQQYHNIDIGLDPFPYVGGTTTCDALWMGVPVVTLAGQSAISRGGASILTNVGIPELIAESTDQYVRLAADLAADLPRLTHLRSHLREKMRTSPLMDAPRFARNMEEAYRKMWITFLVSQ
jgi:protein O-GlcNAc transferase